MLDAILDDEDNSKKYDIKLIRTNNWLLMIEMHILAIEMHSGNGCVDLPENGYFIGVIWCLVID